MTPNTVMTTVSAVDPIYVDFSIAEQDYLRFTREKDWPRCRRSLGADSGRRHGIPSAWTRASGEPRSGLADRDDSGDGLSFPIREMCFAQGNTHAFVQ